MIRFKVVKGSHLLLGAAIIVLALVAAAFLFSGILTNDSAAVNTQASLVQTESIKEEAETHSVFASLHVDPSLKLDPESDQGPDIEIISNDENTATETVRPSVLIYHTHTHEAYEQTPSDQYVAIEAWRTMDQDYSVVRVGSELAQLLRTAGFEVIHDTTDHEQDELGTAYTRSLMTLKSYERTFDLYIDLHRDAYIEGVAETEITDGGQKMAHLMFLIGNGEGFQVKPYYEENLAFAQALTERINAQKSGLCKDVLVKDGRYNQNIGIFSILVEVGHNRNTLQEALRALPYLADGLTSLMISNPDTTLEEMKHRRLN